MPFSSGVCFYARLPLCLTHVFADVLGGRWSSMDIAGEVAVVRTARFY